jgi:ABC-type lipoprotein export system ATPase subunit
MISVSQLSFNYASGLSIIFPDFQVTKGRHLLLLGESGSGKTTLLHLLGGLLRGYSGSLQIEDVELRSLKESSLDKFRAQHLGFVFQRNHLIHALTVEQNLMMPFYLANSTIRFERIDEVLRTLNIIEKRKSKISELSQGQAQRVAIARAVMNSPSIILADEPTSALDDKNCTNVISLLMEVATTNKSTLIIATHDLRLKEIVKNQISLN